MKENDTQKFMESVSKECWLWTGRTSNGYGVTCIDGVSTTAHRISYILFNGDIEGDMCIHHKCDAKLCVNPEHLEMMTMQEHGRLHSKLIEAKHSGISSFIQGILDQR